LANINISFGVYNYNPYDGNVLYCKTNMFIFARSTILNRRRMALSCGCGGKKKTTKPDDPCPCGSGEKYKDCCGK
jgi:uncharacterized protein YchJ